MDRLEAVRRARDRLQGNVDEAAAIELVKIKEVEFVSIENYNTEYYTVSLPTVHF